MRLITRSDFDGLACGALLKEAGIIDSWKFVHPKDIQDGLIEATDNDVLANVPYVKGCKLWFDHHSSESERLGDKQDFEGESRIAPSAARIIYEYYGGESRFSGCKNMVEAVDRVDSANLTVEEVMHPTGWILLGFIMDPRTGLGRIRNFNVSNIQLMEMLIEACRSKDIDEILAMPDVMERVKVYFEQNALYKDMILEHTRVDGNVIISDLRNVDPIYPGNRFLIYSLFPEQNISIWIVDGKQKQNCVFAVGHSIINRTSNTNVGHLLLHYGGGGHDKVGTCQIDWNDADKVLNEIIDTLKKDG